MKKLILPVMAGIFFVAGCASTKNSAYKNNPLQSAIAALEKNKSSVSALKKAQQVCHDIEQKGTANISSYTQSNDENRWNGLVNAYVQLQDMYTTVTKAGCNNLLPVKDYNKELATTREAAAAYYYQQGEKALADSSTNGIRTAYDAYNKVLSFVPGYHDTNEKMIRLFSNNNFVVAINPVEDSTFFMDMGMSAGFYNYTNQVLVENLISDLHTNYSSIPFLIVLKYDECLKKGLTPDWLVDINLNRLNLPITTGVETGYINETQQTGTDTAGQPIFAVVAVKTYINCDIIDNASVEVKIDITDAANGSAVFSKSFDANIGTARVSSCDKGSNNNRYSLSLVSRNEPQYSSSNIITATRWPTQGQTSQTLRERAADILYRNLYETYKRSMRDVFEK